MCLLPTKCDDPKWPSLEPVIEYAIRFTKPDRRRAAKRAPPSDAAATFAATAAMFADTLRPVAECGCIWMSSDDGPTWPCPQHILLHSSLLTRALLLNPTRTPASLPKSSTSRLIDALDLDALTYNWLPKLPAFSIVEAIDKYAVAVRDDPTAYEPVPPTKYPTRQQIPSVGAAKKDEIRDEYWAAMVWARDSGALGHRPKRDSDPATRTTFKALRKERADEEAHLKEWSYFFADALKPVLRELAERNKTQAWLRAKAWPIAPRIHDNSSESVVDLEDVDDWYNEMTIYDEETPSISSFGRDVQSYKKSLPFPTAPRTQALTTTATTSLGSTTPAGASRVLKRSRDDEPDEDEEPNSGSTRPSSKRARANVARHDANHAQTANPPNATGQGIGSSSSSSQIFGQAIAPVAPAVPSTAAPAAVSRVRRLRAPPNPGEPHEQVERFPTEQYPCTRFAPKEWTLYCEPCTCWQDPTRRAQWHNEKSLQNHKKRCQAAPLPPGLESAENGVRDGSR